MEQAVKRTDMLEQFERLREERPAVKEAHAKLMDVLRSPEAQSGNTRDAELFWLKAGLTASLEAAFKHDDLIGTQRAREMTRQVIASSMEKGRG